MVNALLLTFPFLGMPVFSIIAWIWLDLSYKHKQGLKHTVYQHIHHVLFCCWALLLVLLNILLPDTISWADSAAPILISGLLCIAIGLWDLRAVIVDQYAPERKLLQTSRAVLLAWIVPGMTYMFGILDTSVSIPWFIQITQQTMLKPALVEVVLIFAVIVLGLLLLIILSKVWRDEALIRASQRLRNMRGEEAKEIVAIILESSEEKRIQTRLFSWQLTNFLLGLWPPCLLILLMVLGWSRSIPEIFVASGWMVVALLAIFQTFHRLPGAIAALPDLARKRKVQFNEYVTIGLIDGVTAFPAGLILFVVTSIVGPLSLQILGVAAGGMVLALTWYSIHSIRKFRNRVKGVKTQAKPLQPLTMNMSVSDFVKFLRRMLDLGIVEVFFPRYFDIEIRPLIFLYLVIFGISGFCLAMSKLSSQRWQEILLSK